LPLESLVDHIDELISQITNLTSNLQNIPYPRVKQNIRFSGQNYVNGLKIAKEVITNCIVKRASLLSSVQRKDGRTLPPEEIIRSYWLDQVSGCYRTVERFNTDITTQANPSMPYELYHWLFDLFDRLGLDVTIVLQDSNQYTNDSFEKAIVEPLMPLLKVAKEPLLPGSLLQVETKDFVNAYPIKLGYVISFIKGEACNPLLWPLLIHEVFHITDKEKALMTSHNSPTKGEIPILHENKTVNSRWISEIFADIMAIHYVGPMYAFSLMDYFERVPYVQTIQYPEMCVRLYSVYCYLESVRSTYTDIVHRCLDSFKAKIGEKVLEYEESGELSEEKKEKLEDIYQKISGWFPLLRVNSFKQTLREYVLTAKSVGFENRTNSKFAPFPHLVFSYDEIDNLIFRDRISLAIHPNILLNVILSNLGKYNRHIHYDVLVDSIKKWKIKQAWERSIQNLK